jgi:hypothetical protein
MRRIAYIVAYASAPPRFEVYDSEMKAWSAVAEYFVNVYCEARPCMPFHQRLDDLNCSEATDRKGRTGVRAALAHWNRHTAGTNRPRIRVIEATRVTMDDSGRCAHCGLWLSSDARRYGIPCPETQFHVHGTMDTETIQRAFVAWARRGKRVE